MPTLAAAGQQRGVVAGRVPAIDAEGEFQRRQVEKIDHRHPAGMHGENDDLPVGSGQRRDHGTEGASTRRCVNGIHDMDIEPELVED